MLGCVQKEKIPSDTLIIGIESEIKDLNPITALDANTWHVIEVFSQSLIRINRELSIETDLALDYKIEGGKVFRFKLPSAATFHNGHKVSCEDVLSSFKQAAGPTSRSMTAFRELDSLQCESPREFVLRLKRPDPSFAFAVISTIRILPRDLVFEKTFSDHPVASGPYRFVRRRGRDLIFERFENYQSFELEKPRSLSHFKHLVVRSVQDSTTRYLSLVGGDLDVLINSLSPRKIHEAAKNSHLQIFRSPGTTHQYIGFNLRNPKFKNPKLRRALALAIPREEIIRYKLYGFATVAAGLFSPQLPFGHPGLPPLPYDFEEAKRLFKESQVKDFNIEIKCSTDRDITSILLVVKEAWERLGLKVTLRPYEFATFFSQVLKGDFEVFSLRHTGVVDPDLMNKIYHSKEVPPGRNRVYYSHPGVDRALDLAKNEMNFYNRRKLYHEVQEQIYEDLPYIPLWFNNNVAVAQKSLKNFVMYPTGVWRAALEAHKDSE